MQIKTTRFGDLEVDPNAVITFTQPIIGFQEFRRFLLMDGPCDYLRWLQSVDSPELAFILLLPKIALPEYEVTITSGDLVELAVSSAEELEVYTLVVVPKDPAQVRTNLRAPILISPKHRLGKQVILDRSDYPIQYFLAQGGRGQGSPQETTNARTDA